MISYFRVVNKEEKGRGRHVRVVAIRTVVYVVDPHHSQALGGWGGGGTSYPRDIHVARVRAPGVRVGFRDVLKARWFFGIFFGYCGLRLGKGNCQELHSPPNEVLDH